MFEERSSVAFLAIFPAGKRESLSDAAFQDQVLQSNPSDQIVMQAAGLSIPEESVQPGPAQIRIYGDNILVNTQCQSQGKVRRHIGFPLSRERACHQDRLRHLAIPGEEDLPPEHLEALGIRRIRVGKRHQFVAKLPL